MKRSEAKFDFDWAMKGFAFKNESDWPAIIEKASEALTRITNPEEKADAIARLEYFRARVQS